MAASVALPDEKSGPDYQSDRPVPGARRAPLEDLPLQPMLATLTDSPFSGPDWVFEPKLDGIRLLAALSGGRARLYSRSGQEMTAQFPALAAALAGQPRDMILDGEVIALDERGAPSFQRLQQRLNLTREEAIRRAEREIPVHYVVFDLLYLDGYDLRGASLADRRSLLEESIPRAPRVSLVEQLPGAGELAYRACLEHGFEGVVAKQIDSRYENRRSRRWLKVKAAATDDFVIGGYTSGTGSRDSVFGSLLLGQYDAEGRLRFAGRVGTGFDARSLREILGKLQPLQTTECPFDPCPPLRAPARWTLPALVAEVKYMQRTRDGMLRAPVFLRLREDKPAAEAVRADSASNPSQDEAAILKSVLNRLSGEENRLDLTLGDARIRLTNLDKTLWPAIPGRRALTKRDLLRYYAAVSPYLLAHLRDRPLTLTRYPEGIDRPFFYQRNRPPALPAYVETVLASIESADGPRELIRCNNLPTLLWLGQIADLELHSWFSRANSLPDAENLAALGAGNEADALLDYPDYLVFDLDPYLYAGHEAQGEEPALNRRGFRLACTVARRIRDLMGRRELAAFLKTTGKTGLHIYVPVIRRLTFDDCRAVCEAVGRHLLTRYPEEVTMEWRTARRTGRVFVDYNMNARGKTVASVYSPRAVPEAAVSMPVAWDELDQVYPTDFTILNGHERLARLGDLWDGILGAKKDLADLLIGSGD